MESESSIWNLTLFERRNAATLIQNTTLRPFVLTGNSLRCFYCFESIAELSNLLEHTTKHEIPDRTYLLQKYIYKGKRAIQVDISKLQCRICYAEYPNLDAIKNHLLLEHGKEFFPATNGMIEFNMATTDGTFKCQTCSEVFYDFGVLNTHMNVHFRKVVCEHCGEGFLYQHQYLTHREIHLKDSYTCFYCDKVFPKRSQLKYHMRVIHKGMERAKTTKCPHCPLTFKEYYSKICHLKDVHGITKTFQCHICKKKFNTRRALTEHVTKDHTEKHKCEVCFKSFTTESKLKQHILVHTKEKNFVCSVCNKAFIHKKSLQKHKKTHEEPNTPFRIVCATCGTAFCRKNDYTKHMKLWHFFGEADEYESDENLFFQL